MKRFHAHVHVDDLAQSIAFYSKLFAAAPARVEADYAKWMLEDPRVNFAISARGAKPGLDHFGMQTDDALELAELKARAEAADMALLDEGNTTCCYARSEKHWVTDPQGIAWSTFTPSGTSPSSTKPHRLHLRAPAARQRRWQPLHLRPLGRRAAARPRPQPPKPAAAESAA